ncbi:MAG: SurA N-terminal domain-containing protein [Candidatus Omnitrophica bacterium]|nr:SurA N-terminal domain-containing protein [Candidatus Omnitrophota bacterium]
MLKNLRKKKTAKKIWIILAFLVLPPFVLWGSGSLMRSKTQADFKGKIFGKTISYLEYRDALDAVKNSGIMQFGDKFSEIEKHLNLESQAWDRLILLHEAKKRKIDATDREVIGLIESYPFFQRKGAFDNRIYSELLQYVFHTKPRVFEEQTRQNLMLSKLYEDETKNITVSEKEAKDEYRKLNEQISIDYIAGIPLELTKDLAPSEQEVKDYFAKDPLQFKQPLSFNVEYLTIDNEGKMKDVILRINKKEEFSKIAKETGISLKETGLFTQADPIPGIGWSPEVLNLLSKLKVGEFSPPLHLDEKYYILRLREKKEAYIPDFEKIKDKVRESLIKMKSSETAKNKIDDCLKKIKESYKPNGKSIDLQNIAKEYGLKAGVTGLFNYGSYIEGIGASDSFWLNAQRLKEKEFSEIIALPSGFYIIRVKAKVRMDENKFEKEKPDFTKKILSQKKQEYFVQFIEGLKRKTQ